MKAKFYINCIGGAATEMKAGKILKDLGIAAEMTSAYLIGEVDATSPDVVDALEAAFDRNIASLGWNSPFLKPGSAEAQAEAAALAKMAEAWA